ncbi:MAG: SpoIIE family protein phosphatase, partial [Leptospira sp.]|nr:SpoIIE family protein phosphatase [Leptospira sp.]
LLTAVMESVKSVFRTESCSILLVDKEKKDLYFHIVAGEKQEEISRVRVPIGQGIAGTIAITKKPMIINDAQNDPRVFKGVDKATSFVTRNILGAALVVNDEVIGVMEAINTIDRNNFNSTDIDLFLSFSDAAALAIQKTRLLENLERTNVELEKKVGELESLFELGQAVLESKDEIDLLIRSVQIISVELSCEKTSIGILNDSKDKLTVISIIDDAEKITNIHLVQNSMVAESMTGNQIISVNDFKDIKRNGIDDVYLGDSFIIFPLAQANKNPFGAIIVSRKTSDGGFGESQVRFLQTISSQIIKGYENFKLNRGMIEKRAIEKEIEITRNIQNNILPSIQLSKSNYDLGIKTVPAKEVSGDFYDYFQYSDGQFSFLIADVSGKSLPAAIFMAMSSSIIRTLARNQNLMPDEILRQANDLIYEDSQSGMFVTLFFVQYNPALLEINYGSAGHNDQIWIKKDGSYSLIRGSGAPLGVMP